MFGPSVLALALTPGFVLGSPQVDTAAVGRGEVMVGSAPPFPREPPEAALVMTATPGLAARLREPRYTLILQAAPRIYYRVPNLLDLHRPLYLVGTRDSLQYRLSQRLDWTTRVDGTYGEVDYTSQQLVFGPIARQVDQPVTRVVALRGDTGLSWSVTRRYTLQLTAYGQHTEPIGKSAQNFPTTNGVRFRVQPRYQLDRVSAVDLDVSTSVYFVDPGGGYIGVAAAA